MIKIPKQKRKREFRLDKLEGLTFEEAWSNYWKARKVYFELTGTETKIGKSRNVPNHAYVSKINYDTSNYLKKIAEILSKKE